MPPVPPAAPHLTGSGHRGGFQLGEEALLAQNAVPSGALPGPCLPHQDQLQPGLLRGLFPTWRTVICELPNLKAPDPGHRDPWSPLNKKRNSASLCSSSQTLTEAIAQSTLNSGVSSSHSCHLASLRAPADAPHLVGISLGHPLRNSRPTSAALSLVVHTVWSCPYLRLQWPVPHLP
uniref:Uncharacterized protein n=1 Tax=Molossus molossus TaxID=27622 RepID=A0A7J8HCS5_MOLMO|nr:hypothetical protein HJG59_011209 [Molossus molossus]